MPSREQIINSLGIVPDAQTRTPGFSDYFKQGFQGTFDPARFGGNIERGLSNAFGLTQNDPLAGFTDLKVDAGNVTSLLRMIGPKQGVPTDIDPSFDPSQVVSTSAPFAQSGQELPQDTAGQDEIVARFMGSADPKMKQFGLSLQSAIFERNMKAAPLRGEFINASKDFKQQSESIGRVRASAKDASAAGDLALIFNYMKILDPGSTVREGEFANAESAGGVEDRVVALYNKIRLGQRLSPEQRRDFVERAEALYGEARGHNRTITARYQGLAQQVGLPSNLVTIDYDAGDVPEDLLNELKTASRGQKQASPSDDGYRRIYDDYKAGRIKIPQKQIDFLERKFGGE